MNRKEQRQEKRGRQPPPGSSVIHWIPSPYFLVLGTSYWAPSAPRKLTGACSSDWMGRPTIALREKSTAKKLLSIEIRSHALALTNGECNHSTSQMLMLIYSVNHLKNRNVDALLISYYTVAFRFYIYLKKCAHITNEAHEHVKKVHQL